MKKHLLFYIGMGLLAMPLIGTSHGIRVTGIELAGVSREAITNRMVIEEYDSLPLYQLNTGGPAIADWEADQYVTGGQTNIEAIPIAGTQNDEIYQTERYGETFTYEIPTGIMDSLGVKLHFAEIYHGISNSNGIGARVFNVDIENGQGQLNNYDIIEKAGATATAIVETFSGIQVTDSSLTIVFTAIADKAKISGIEVLSSGTANSPPVLARTGNLDLNEGDSISVNIAASDQNGDIPQLMTAGLPDFASFTDNGDGTGLLSLLPGPGDAGRYKVKLTATDLGGLTGEENITVFVSTGLETVLTRINSGGPAYTFNGENWEVDQYADSSKTNIEWASIAGTENDQLYQTERYDSAFSYNIPVDTTGPLTVKLHFAEVYFGVDNPNTVGARVFNVDIENGQGQLNNYDIIKRAGAPATAIIESFADINVTDGNLTIAFTRIKNYAKISGIEILTDPMNRPPVLDSIGTQYVLERETTDVNISAWDPDGQSLDIVATGLPAFASFTDNNNGTGTLSLAPGAEDEGQYPITITATDQGGLSDSENFSLSVANNTTILTLLYRINTGGPAFGDWEAEQYVTGGATYSNAIAIAGTENDQLYQSEHYGESFTYEIPIDTTAPLAVKLHFAEIYHGVNNAKGIGARILDVDIENGQGQLNNYDIIERAGGPATAIVETFNGIQVTDGSLTLVFTNTVDKAKVSGIEVFIIGQEEPVTYVPLADNVQNRPNDATGP